jgi:hypothetical protein
MLKHTALKDWNTLLLSTEKEYSYEAYDKLVDELTLLSS